MKTVTMRAMTVVTCSAPVAGGRAQPYARQQLRPTPFARLVRTSCVEALSKLGACACAPVALQSDPLDTTERHGTSISPVNRNRRSVPANAPTCAAVRAGAPTLAWCPRPAPARAERASLPAPLSLLAANKEEEGGGAGAGTPGKKLWRCRGRRPRTTLVTR